ncbi:unnamed protein product [Pleuronectes platessa]|uniref:Uncharacterized protein n=1 Tax=Pleuronectes platessa TaxID=8262 RepID=A0A9N7UWB7_PLEPL|nr:unnamed protein product [Pleuronectes platessa]
MASLLNNGLKPRLLARLSVLTASDPPAICRVGCPALRALCAGNLQELYHWNWEKETHFKVATGPASLTHALFVNETGLWEMIRLLLDDERPLREKLRTAANSEGICPLTQYRHCGARRETQRPQRSPANSSMEKVPLSLCGQLFKEEAPVARAPCSSRSLRKVLLDDAWTGVSSFSGNAGRVGRSR